MSIKILLVEDHVIVREGICSLIEKEHDMEVVGQAGDGVEAIKLTYEKHPDVVIMDISMPKMNGIEATRKIKIEMPDVKVLVLSANNDRELVMDMVKAGSLGYVLKDCIYEELAGAIRAVNANKAYLSPEITAIVLDEHKIDRSSKLETSAATLLRANELKLLILLAEGKSAKEIAVQNNENVKTIEARRRRIMKKVGVNNFADLIKYAIREDLTSC